MTLLSSVRLLCFHTITSLKCKNYAYLVENWTLNVKFYKKVGLSINNPERPKSAPRSRYKKVKFFNYKKKTIVKISSILQCQKYPKAYALESKITFSPNKNHNKPENPKEFSMLGILFLSSKNEGGFVEKSRIVPIKTPILKNSDSI